MRGGFVACLNGNGRLLDQVVEHMRWHRGKGVRDHRNGLEIAALVDGPDGPAVDTGRGQTLLVHGAAPAPLAELLRCQTRFSAVEWDGRRLRASRDPIGLAPLFYRVFQGGVWLATEVQPLVALGSPPPDLEALTARAVFAPIDDRTGWEGIGRVLPGSTLEVGPDGRVSSVRYWKPAEALGRHRGSRTEAVAEFRERFRTAVRRCYEPGSGILLSGGLDSAAVALVVADEGQARPHLTHIHYPDLPKTYEREYAAAVAAAVGAPLHVVPGYVDPWDVDAELDGWGGIAYSWLPYGMEDAALAHLAASGVTVALDGHDGDGVLGPLGSNWGDLILNGQFHRFGALAARHGAWPAARGLAVDFLPPHRWLLRLAGRPARTTYMQSVARYFRGPLRDRSLEADIERWMWPSRRWGVRQLQPLLPRATISFEQKELEAARHGIDLRHPFADRELVEFLISLPSALKSDPMRPKAVLVDSLSDLLPKAVQERPKSDYMAAVRLRVDPAACIERIRASGVRLPGIEYGRLFEDARVDLDGVRLYFLVNLTRVHAFAQRAHEAAGGAGKEVPRV
jgi:asparagine synthase (glutamine-hydrolysing)